MRKSWMYGGAVAVGVGILVAAHFGGPAGLFGVKELVGELHGPGGGEAHVDAEPGAVAGGSQTDFASTAVPLRMEGGRLLVPVDVGHGVQADFILSTGNGVTVLSQAFADRHDTSGPFMLGEIEVNLAGAATVPHEDIAPDGEMIVGIIGSNSLNRYDMLIDLPGERLVLKPAGREVSWEGVALSDPIRIRVYHGLVIGMDVEVNGRTYPAMLDTGTPSLVMNAGAAEGVGLDGDGDVTLSLGSFAAEAVPAQVRELPILDRWDPDGEGFVIVGSPIARDCAVAVSWMHREIRTCAR